jgi:hypothetical protein
MVATDDRDRRRFLARLRSAYDRARSHRSGGQWTLAQPAWWVDTSTVERRRRLTPTQRDVWLRRRKTAA